MQPSEKDFRRLKSTLGYTTSEYLGVQVYEFRVPPKMGAWDTVENLLMQSNIYLLY